MSLEKLPAGSCSVLHNPSDWGATSFRSPSSTAPAQFWCAAATFMRRIEPRHIVSRLHHSFATESREGRRRDSRAIRTLPTTVEKDRWQATGAAALCAREPYLRGAVGLPR